MSTITNICRYVVKPGKEAEMERLLALHWPTLRDAGLATDEPAMVFRGIAGGRDDAARQYVEIFSWSSERAPEVAHQTPAIMAIWEPMGALCERLEFPKFEKIAGPPAK